MKNKWTGHEYPKVLKRLKQYLIGENTLKILKKNGMTILIENLKGVKKVFGLLIKVKPTYITGTHYMYLQWSKIDVGQADFRESNRLFFIFWEACKADTRCYGMCYLKNRRSGFSFMASGETVNMATISTDARFGILSKSGADAKKCLPIRSYQFQLTTLSSSNQYKTVWIDRKQSLHTEFQLVRFTRSKLDTNEN